MLDNIMNSSDSARDNFMMWLFGPAGAGKSVIAKRIAETAVDKGLRLIAFFSSPGCQRPETLKIVSWQR